MVNPFKRLAHRKPPPEGVRTLVEALHDLHGIAPAAWEPEIGLAIGYARARNWDRLWDRLQAAAGANRGTPFGDAAELLRARAEKLSLANAPARPTHPT